MRILVTGGAGYIGSVTVDCLLAKGHTVAVLDDLFRGHRAALDSRVPFYQGKVGDRELVARIVAEHKVEACVHFAALAFVGESMSEPARYFENNVEQGIALIGALKEANVRRFVFSSTCATYGEPEKMPISEATPQWPTNPYGWSKLALERVLDSYDRAYGFKFAALRYFNASGATATKGEFHEPETHLVPNVLKAAATGAEVAVFGDKYPTPDGTAVRDYIHVLDLAEAHVLALDKLAAGSASMFLNLGTGRGYSVLEVIETAKRVTARPIRTRIEGPRAGDPPSLVADARRAGQVLNWKPRVSDLASILKSQWEWRQNHPQGYSQ
jgi:UDP-glucose 4-epimerase